MNLKDQNPALVLPWVGRARAAAARLKCSPSDWAESHGAPSAAVRILRSGVGASSLASDALGDTAGATRAFLTSLQTRSVLARLFADGAITRVPLQKRVGYVSADATAWSLSEGNPVPLSRLQLESGTIEPRRVSAMLVCTDEFFADGGPAVEQAFNRSLADAVSKTLDADFFDQLMSDTDFEAIESSGPDAEDALLDLHTALATLQPSSDKLYWVGPRDVAIRASCIGDGAGRLFDTMSPVGGELLGLPFLVSNAVDDLILLDAAALAGDLGAIDLRASTQASIEMQDSDGVSNDSTVPQAASLVSMFQSGAVCLLANVSYGLERLRPAVAAVSNVAWSGTVTV